MTHDFKAAEKWFEKRKNRLHPSDINHYETIIAALRIADAVMKDPVSIPSAADTSQNVEYE